MDWQAFGNVTVHILAGLTMLIGWLSLLIVIVPGLVIMWVGALGYGIATGFDTTGWIIFAIMTVLMVVGSLIDNFLMGASARQKGASWWSLGAAWVGAVIGTFLLPPVGGLILALVALFLVEYFRMKDAKQALESSTSLATGCGWAVGVRFAIGFIMLVLWILWAFVIK
ncbi:MAG: DUF456 domain-containing protein [Anaerolineaceae bacterium]|jgi:uncharacterized protein YqgC (DUF456 family)|nr:DUF456 domain-containing protein [Anaerolineaceae bacterium]